MAKVSDIVVKVYTDSPSYWAVPPMWTNGTAFILGGGPSLQLMAGIDVHELNNKRIFRQLREHFLPLLKGVRVIGVNSAFKLGEEIVDICWFTDNGWYIRNKPELKNFSGLKVHCCNKHILRIGTKWLKRKRPQWGIHTKFNDTVCWNANSGGSAINLAYHLGVTRVVLIGFDMKKVENRNNFHTEHAHGGYCQKGGYPKDWNPYPRFAIGFDKIKKQADVLDNFTIVNATPGTALEIFKKVKLEDEL